MLIYFFIFKYSKKILKLSLKNTNLFPFAIIMGESAAHLFFFSAVGDLTREKSKTNLKPRESVLLFAKTDL